MHQLLDLRLTLTQPNKGASAHVIARLEMRCDALDLAPVRGWLSDPLSPQERKQLRWYLEEYWKWPFEQFLQRARDVEHLLSEIGQRFYQQLAFDTKAHCILQAWSTTEANQHRISISSKEPAVLTLPWELLHDEQGFLALRNHQPVSIIRTLPQPQPPSITMPRLPLRILLIMTRPEEIDFLDPRSDARVLYDAMQEQIDKGAIEVEFLRPPTLPALRERLSNPNRPPIHNLAL